MKYFVLGALASGLLLYGISLIYGTTGALDFGGVAKALHSGIGSDLSILVVGVIFVIAGVAFKLGVAPFHLWVPDVYHGAPAVVTQFIASAPKLAAYAMALRLLVNALFGLVDQWQIMLMIFAVLSIGIGNLAAIAQTNIKRMLAYSGIAHMGFMLLAFMSGATKGHTDALQAINAYASALFYSLTYALMALGAFAVLLLLSSAEKEAELLDDFKGLNRRSPWLAALMLIFMLSMAGIPFFVGFFAKFAVLLPALDAGYLKIVIFAVLFSLIGAYYYLRVIKFMYFDHPTTETPITVAIDFKVLLTVNGLAVVVLGLFPDPIIHLCIKVVGRSFL